MAKRRTVTATLLILTLTGAGLVAFWLWIAQLDDAGEPWRDRLSAWLQSTPPQPPPAPATPQSTASSAAVASPPQTTEKTATMSPTARKTLDAEWRSFSFNPPRYAIENLLIYKDLSCEVTVAKDDSRQPCSWQRIEGDRIQVTFENNSRIIGQLTAPLSTLGKQKPGTAGYLVVDLGNDRRQLFVLAGSEDDKMVLDTVRGEWDWSNGKFKTGVGHLRSAFARGSNYARIRLGWIYATVAEFQLPKVSLKLLEPLRVNRNYGALNALAAAYAANQQFEKAASTAQTACELAPEGERPGCQERLQQYRAGKPFVVPAGSNG